MTSQIRLIDIRGKDLEIALSYDSEGNCLLCNDKVNIFQVKSIIMLTDRNKPILFEKHNALEANPEAHLVVIAVKNATPFDIRFLLEDQAEVLGFKFLEEQAQHRVNDEVILALSQSIYLQTNQGGLDRGTFINSHRLLQLKLLRMTTTLYMMNPALQKGFGEAILMAQIVTEYLRKCEDHNPRIKILAPELSTIGFVGYEKVINAYKEPLIVMSTNGSEDLSLFTPAIQWDFAEILNNWEGERMADKESRKWITRLLDIILALKVTAAMPKLVAPRRKIKRIKKLPVITEEDQQLLDEDTLELHPKEGDEIEGEVMSEEELEEGENEEGEDFEEGNNAESVEEAGDEGMDEDEGVEEVLEDDTDNDEVEDVSDPEIDELLKYEIESQDTEIENTDDSIANDVVEVRDDEENDEAEDEGEVEVMEVREDEVYMEEVGLEAGEIMEVVE